MNAKTKAARHVFLLVQESDARCPHGYRLLKNEESRDQADSKAKKNHSATYNKSRNRNRDRLSQALSQSFKKDSHSNKRGQQNQSFNTFVTGSNATVVKKDKMQGNMDLSQVKCYTCHKKDDYFNKCPDKKAKN